MKIFDITLPMHPGMPVFPGDPELAQEAVAALRPGDAGSYAMTRLTLSTHCGTHVDAPAHFIEGGAGIDQVPLERLCGLARVVDVTALGPALGARALVGLELGGVERLLLRTRRHRSAAFDEGFAHLTAEGARYVLEETTLGLIGLDSPSIDGATAAGFAVHHALLGASPPLVIVENLDLAEVEPGDYELFCLPLRLRDGDGAPARAVLVQRG